jgi:hypothetical protein
MSSSQEPNPAMSVSRNTKSIFHILTYTEIQSILINCLVTHLTYADELEVPQTLDPLYFSPPELQQTSIGAFLKRYLFVRFVIVHSMLPRLMKTLFCSPFCFIFSMIYLDRLGEEKFAVLRSSTAHRFVLVRFFFHTFWSLLTCVSFFF